MELIERAFTKMGARVKIVPTEAGRGWREVPSGFSLDVRDDMRGEYFRVSQPKPGTPELVVLDVQPRQRHLLLLTRAADEKHRFLLGHDERHWFVAGIPEARPVSRVQDAMEALKPDAVRQGEYRLRPKDRSRRSNQARIRQGEWFFLPAPDVRVPPMLVLRREPLVRSNGGKPHVCEQLFRFGGETVYVSGAAPGGLTEAQYQGLPDAERKQWNWRVMRRNPKMYVRGAVRHSDHKTVLLDGWHEVLSNTEDQSAAMKNVVFLD
jgi:hypothetical protein